MYDTYDLAPCLVAGKNVLAALVWNMGEQTPYAPMTSQTGFIVQGHGESEKNSQYRIPPGKFITTLLINQLSMISQN